MYFLHDVKYELCLFKVKIEHIPGKKTDFICLEHGSKNKENFFFLKTGWGGEWGGDGALS